MINTVEPLGSTRRADVLEGIEHHKQQDFKSVDMALDRYVLSGLGLGTVCAVAPIHVLQGKLCFTRWCCQPCAGSGRYRPRIRICSVLTLTGSSLQIVQEDPGAERSVQREQDQLLRRDSSTLPLDLRTMAPWWVSTGVDCCDVVFQQE